MAHPIMFRQDDPVLIRLREITLALPGATEKVSHGRPWFSTKTGFAVFGGSERGSTTDRIDHALLVKVPPEEADALRQDGRFWEPAYLWSSGWLGIDLDLVDEGELTWQEVAELVEDSFRLTAPASWVKELDAR
ncbi:MmcQ/YjbR family DNA-binding protein [Kytococcus sedentarius]|uniref:MmcQ/YjbR family DNA-binding protein n=1 Tax=Kytococcus sedentarius TaxID=1276 RepID=UPI0035BC1B23